MEHDLACKDKEGNGEKGENAHATRHLLEGDGGVQPFIDETHDSSDAKAKGYGNAGHDAKRENRKNQKKPGFHCRYSRKAAAGPRFSGASGTKISRSTCSTANKAIKTPPTTMGT